MYVKPKVEILELETGSPILMEVSGNAGRLIEEDGFLDNAISDE